MNKKILSVIAASAALLLNASSTLPNVTIPTVNEEVKGQWIGDFTLAKSFAERTRTPMILLYSKSGCDYCNQLKSALKGDTTSKFTTWQAGEGAKFIYCLSSVSAASKFAKPEDSGKLPFVSLYWPNGATTNKYNFTARISDNVTTNGQDPGKLAALVIDKATEFFAGYSEYAGGEFKVSGVAGDRLEAVEKGATTKVAVPLTRKDATEAYHNVLKVGSSDGEINSTLAVDWAVGEDAKSIEVTLSAGLTAGTTVSLQLLDADGKSVASSCIYIVAKPENSVINPSWRAQDFTVGEWTLNYAAATNAVATGAAEKLLVLFDGTLWCPYCKGMEASLLADAAFPAWAKANRLALMQFDQGRASTPATAAGTRAPRLTTYEPDPKTAGDDTVSGAAYVSRTMLDSVTADAIIDLTTEYTAKFLAPNSTSARMSQPSMLLVKNEKVVGRFTAYRDADRVYEVKENLARLDDFLKLWERDDESSDYLQTTLRSHEIGGAASAIDFQLSDRNEYFRLTGAAAGRLTFSAVNSVAGREVVLSLYADGKVVAVGTNSLSTVAGADLAKSSLYLGLTAYPSTSEKFFADAAFTTSCFRTTLTSSFEAIPGSVAFRDRELAIQKTTGGGEIVVKRTGGCSGEAKFRVRILEGSAPEGVRYTWDENAVYGWADGEDGELTLDFKLNDGVAYRTNEVVRLALETVSGAAAVAVEPLTITLIDTDKPVTAKTQYNLSLYSGFTAISDEDLTVNNLQGGSVTLKKVSGTLPKGVTVKYDKKTGSLVVSGTPSKTTEATVVYTIIEKTGSGRNKTTSTGPEITFNFSVTDPAEENPYLSRAFTVTLPLLRGAEMVGVITLSATAKNALTAKVICDADTKTLSLKGKWSDLEGGTAYATLTAKTAELDLSMSADGTFNAELKDNRYPGETLTAVGVKALTEAELQPCKGNYTVALIDENAAGYLTLDFSTASYVKKGTVKFSGALPDGTAISGTAGLCGFDEDFVCLPFFVNTRKARLSALVKIRRDAATAAKTLSARAIVGVDAIASRWESSSGAAGEVEVYGSFFDASLPLENHFENGAGELVFDGAAAGVDSILGDGAAVSATGTKLALTEAIRNVRLTYTKKTGKFSGSTRVTVGNKAYTGRFAGVLLPGWNECGSCGSDDTLIPALVNELPPAVGQLLFSKSYLDMAIKPL